MSNRKKISSAELVYDGVKKKILNMEFAPGECLSEVRISEELNVSRTPVREALGILEQEGLLTSKRRRKYVAFLTLDDLAQIFEIKIVLESFVAEKAAMVINEETSKGLEIIIDKMRDLVEKIKNAPDKDHYEEWRGINVSFHDYLYFLSGNKRIKDLVDNYNLQWNRWRMGIMAMQWRLEKNIGEHIAMGEAVLRKDHNEAKHLMETHLKDLYSTVSEIIKTFQLMK